VVLVERRCPGLGVAEEARNLPGIDTALRHPGAGRVPQDVRCDADEFGAGSHRPETGPATLHRPVPPNDDIGIRRLLAGSPQQNRQRSRDGYGGALLGRLGPADRQIADGAGIEIDLIPGQVNDRRVTGPGVERERREQQDMGRRFPGRPQQPRRLPDRQPAIARGPFRAGFEADRRGQPSIVVCPVDSCAERRLIFLRIAGATPADGSSWRSLRPRPVLSRYRR